MKNKILKYYNYLVLLDNKNFLEKILFNILELFKKTKKLFLKSDNLFLSRGYLKIISFFEKITNNEYKFISFESSILLVDELVKRFDKRFDIVIGIPRSGLFVANIIALKLGLPLTTPDIIGKIEWKSQAIKGDTMFNKILLVDDSIVSGRTLHAELQKIKKQYPKAEINTAVLIATKETSKLVDYCSILLPKPRLFEWNLMHAKKGTVAVDLDGVLCENLPLGIGQFDKLYEEWLINAKPFLIPEFEIDAIVSNRMEKYREETVNWLKKYGVKYKKLILCPANSREKQKAQLNEHKINSLIKIKPSIYWESEKEEAINIAKKTKIPVLCFEDKNIYN